MRIALLTLLATLVLAAPAAADVPAGRSLLVVGQSGVDKADAVEQATGVKPAGAMWYLGLYEDAAAVDLDADSIAGDGPGDRVRDAARRAWDRISGNY